MSVAPQELSDAIAKGDVAAVEAFLSSGKQRADQFCSYYKSRGKTFSTPLIAYAVSKGQPAILRLLLDAGAGYADKSWLNAVCTEYQCTAVCWAFAIDQEYTGKPEQVQMAKMLIDAGANVELKDHFGDNPEVLLAKADEEKTEASTKNYDALASLLARARRDAPVTRGDTNAEKVSEKRPSAQNASKTPTAAARPKGSSSRAPSVAPKPEAGKQRAIAGVKRARHDASESSEELPVASTTLQEEVRQSVAILREQLRSKEITADTFATAVSALGALL